MAGNRTPSDGSGANTERSREAPIRVLLCDDHEMFREGLAGRLAYPPDIEVVGEASDGEEAVAMARALAPDVVVMDLEMPRMSGFEAMSRIRAENGSTQVLVLTGHGSDSDLLGALDGGVAGYVLKDSPSVALLKAIRQAADGVPHLSYEAASRLALLRQGSSRGALTDRQARVLGLIAQGKTTGEIAKIVGWSTRTIDLDVDAICSKLGARNRQHASALAVQRGIVRVEDP